MKNLKMHFYVVITGIAIIAISCSTSTTENQEVTAMDSVSKELDKSNQELDAQAKKVEASLGKIDKEINNSN